MNDIFNKQIKLEFFIPEGDAGYKGDQGNVGDKGPTGNRGDAYSVNGVNGGFAICTTEEDILDKEVFLDFENDNLNTVNSIVSILFKNRVRANSRLNISNTGYRAILHKGLPIRDDVIFTNTTATFVCDGENYRLIATDYNDYSYLPIVNNWKVINTGSSEWDIDSTFLPKIANMQVVDEGPDPALIFLQMREGIQACWTRGMQGVGVEIGEAEVIKTVDFPFRFLSIPVVNITATLSQIYTNVNPNNPIQEVETCTAEIVGITNSNVTFKLKRSDIQRPNTFLYCIKAEL